MKNKINNNIVILGAFGFIGLNLINFFLKTKYIILAIGNKNSHFKHSKKKNLITKNCNLYDYKKYKKLINFKSVVIFLGIPKKKSRSFSKSYSDLLTFLKKNKIKKYILISSIAVYGNYKLRKIKENFSLKGKTVYSKNCIKAENITRKILCKEIFDVKILRVSNVFGMFRYNKLGIVEQLIYNFTINQNYKFSNQNIYRSIVSIKDLSSVIFYFIKKKNNDLIFNISNTNYIYRFYDLLNKILKVIKVKRNNLNLIFFKKDLKIDHSIISSQKLEKIYSFKKKTNSFYLEIREIINFFHRNKNNLIKNKN